LGQKSKYTTLLGAETAEVELLGWEGVRRKGLTPGKVVSEHRKKGGSGGGLEAEVLGESADGGVADQESTGDKTKRERYGESFQKRKWK